MNDLVILYDDLMDHFGPQHWWPAESDFEMIIGAILTQNVNWKNVEKAISQLKDKVTLEPESMIALHDETIHDLVRPSGFFRQKSERLKILSKEIVAVGGVEDYLEQDNLRDELLGIKGIGHETADCIALYAGDRPYFVVDTYTKRIVERRYGILGDYDKIQTLFHNNIPKDTELYREFHALLVRLAKEYCRKKPDCSACPVKKGCVTGI